jgi:gas vesicle protein
VSGGGPGFKAGAVLGGLLGAGLAMLFAPRSGEQTRRDLATWRESSRSTDVEANSLDEVLGLGNGMLRTSLERLEIARDAARQAAEDARRTLSEEWERRKLGLN